MAVPLDEYPIHQVPLSFAHVGTSDRNFYDRNIFHCFDRDGSTLLMMGMGVYVNLGVIDAYATVRRGDRQVAVRTSDAMPEDRMRQECGPIRFEIVEPLKTIRAICDAPDRGLAFDLTWSAVSEPIDEPLHIIRRGPRTIVEGCRYAQTGSWAGTLNVEGADFALDDWIGTRDRSWGIRGSGEAEAPGRPDSAEPGFWWCWVPLRFDDHSILVIAQEGRDGERTMSEALRIWPSGSGIKREQLGFPELDITYRSGSRHPVKAQIHLADRKSRKPITIDVTTLTGIALNVGCGYGPDPDWQHGVWKGEGWVDSSVYDYTDPVVAGRVPFSLSDHAAHALSDGQEGWGIFEHGSIGRHDPTGFADLFAVAP